MRLAQCAVLLLLTAPLTHANIRASLPLHGYSRPGYFVPVRLEGTSASTEIEITGDGVTPTRVAVSGGALNVVVPVLTVESADGMVVRELDSGKPIPIQPVANRMFDGGVLSRGRVLVGNATDQPVLHIVAVANDIPLDPQDPVPGPAMAWEALDYLVIQPAGAARIGDAKLLDLLAANVTILYLGEQSPPGSLAWARAADIILGRTDVWTLRPELRGPRGSMFEHALRPLAGAEAGSSDAVRWNVLLAGALFVILATAAALLLPARRPLVAAAAVGGVVLLTLGGVHVWWARQPAGPTVGGWIIVEQPPFTQVDTWIYYSLRRGETLNLPADLRPVTESTDALARLRPTLRCAADGTPIGYSCVGSGEHVAAVARKVVLGQPPTPDVEPTVTSPLLPMVKRGYLQPGSRPVTVAGQAPGQPWPTVVIRAAEPVRGAATRAVK